VIPSARWGPKALHVAFLTTRMHLRDHSMQQCAFLCTIRIALLTLATRWLGCLRIFIVVAIY
jgi:hypothetical protein